MSRAMRRTLQAVRIDIEARDVGVPLSQLGERQGNAQAAPEG